MPSGDPARERGRAGAPADPGDLEDAPVRLTEAGRMAAEAVRLLALADGDRGDGDDWPFRVSARLN